MGCTGGGTREASKFTCSTATREDLDTMATVTDSWGGDGGSGILFIRFDVCPGNDDGN